MNTIHQGYSRLRPYLAALLLASGSSASFAQTTPAASDDAMPPRSDTLVMEKFVTTGSSIKRTDTEKVLPVTVFSAQQIEARDSVTTMDLVAGIPQVTNIPANETSVNAVASRGGNAAAALRGIGAENTLILFNGRRVPFNPISGGPPWISTVNVNTLPTLGLAQVEVLRDGASALYGTDAVAGVINFITDSNVNGGTAVVRFGMTEQGGGSDILGSVNYGTLFADGKGRWVTTLSAYNRDAIYLRERETSKSSNRLDQARAPWNIPGSVYDGRAPATAAPTFRLGTAAISGTVYSLNATPAITTTARPREEYDDYNLYTTGQPMSSRFNLFSRMEYDLTPSLTVFGEVLGYIAESRTGRQPITLNSSDARVTLAVDNPYNPFGSAFITSVPNTPGKVFSAAGPQPITITSKLMNEGGNENVEATDRMYRVLTGLKGKFGDTWEWETAAVLGAYRITDDDTNAVRESLLQRTALRNGPDAWNPFGYTFKVLNGAVVVDQPYTNPEEVQDFFTQSAKRFGHSRMASFDARVGGEVVELWAGPIAAAVGIEWRYESKADYKAPYVSINPPGGTNPDLDNNDILVTSPKYNYEASRTIASAYGETIVPLIARKNDIPFADSLELNASLRFERYSDFGETTKPKVGLNWKPVPSVMVRGSYNQGFRAPDLTSMEQPASFSVATPPGTRDTVRNNYFIGANQAVDAQVLNKTYSLPNPDLGPEESEGITAGVVFEVPHVKGLSIGVDYWEIKQENLIFSQTRKIEDDAALLLAYTQQQLGQGKNIFDINVGSRTSLTSPNTYVGDQYTLRAAPTADDIARFAATYAVLPQSQWIAPLGTWLGATTQEVNGTGTALTNGFDYEIDYNLPRTSFGQFRVTSTWSQFLNKFKKETPTDPKDDDIISMLLPEWRSSTTVQWRKNAWSASLNATYASDIRTNATTNAAGYANAGSPSYIKVINNNGQTFYYEEGQSTLQLNLGVTYKFASEANRWVRNTSVRVGVNNLLGEEPPLVTANEAGTSTNVTGYSGSSGSSLWIGRAYSVTLTREF